MSRKAGARAAWRRVQLDEVAGVGSHRNWTAIVASAGDVCHSKGFSLNTGGQCTKLAFTSPYPCCMNNEQVLKYKTLPVGMPVNMSIGPVLVSLPYHNGRAS